MSLHLVKTPSGYFYAVAGGRYGRFAGRENAWSLCDRHKDELIKSLSIAIDINTIEIEQSDSAQCDQCRINNLRR